MKTITIVGVLMGAVSLTACGAMDSVSREQAENGVKLMSSLQVELDSFRKEEEATEAGLVASFQVHREFILNATASENEDRLLLKTAGGERITAAESKFDQLLQGLAQLEADKRPQQEALSKEMKALLEPLPSTAKASNDTQLKFAEMAKPLSFKVKFSEFKAFATSIEKNIKDNKKKIDDLKKEPVSQQ